MSIRQSIFASIAAASDKAWDETRIAVLDDCLDRLGVARDDLKDAATGFQTPGEFCADTLMAHEGGLSMDRTDRGNWFKGQLIGSKFGVTAAALASYRGTKTITAPQMAALTKDEAVQVALSDYYERPKIDDLEWNAVTASILDMGYNAGPKTAIKLMQRMIGVNGDGVIGQFTDRAFSEYLQDHGVEKTAQDYCAKRIDYYERIIARRPQNSKYRRGWQARARSFLPGTSWWRKFGKGQPT